MKKNCYALVEMKDGYIAGIRYLFKREFYDYLVLSTNYHKNNILKGGKKINNAVFDDRIKKEVKDEKNS